MAFWSANGAPKRECLRWKEGADGEPLMLFEVTVVGSLLLKKNSHRPLRSRLVSSGSKSRLCVPLKIAFAEQFFDLGSLRQHSALPYFILPLNLSRTASFAGRMLLSSVESLELVF